MTDARCVLNKINKAFLPDYSLDFFINQILPLVNQTGLCFERLQSLADNHFPTGLTTSEWTEGCSGVEIDDLNFC